MVGKLAKRERWPSGGRLAQAAGGRQFALGQSGEKPAHFTHDVCGSRTSHRGKRFIFNELAWGATGMTDAPF
ncbi:MAG: hypothetical protein QF721_07830 [Verrucomicrobiota bacterium]|nr:hypothetical protein [Verrucomicrobiota bacterium]